MVKHFGVLHTVLLAEGAATGKDKLFDVVPVGGYIVVTKKRKFLAPPRQFHPELWKSDW